MNAPNTASLDTKPTSGGTPAIDAAASTATTNSGLDQCRSPDNSRRSRVPAP